MHRIILLVILSISLILFHSCENEADKKVILPPPNSSEPAVATPPAPPAAQADPKSEPSGIKLGGSQLGSDKATGNLNGILMMADLPLHYIEVIKKSNEFVIFNPCNAPPNMLNFDPQPTYLYLLLEGEHQGGYLVSDTQSIEHGKRFSFQTTQGPMSYTLQIIDQDKNIYKWVNETKGLQYEEYYVPIKYAAQTKSVDQNCEECFSNCDEIKNGASPIPLKKDE